MKIYDMLFIKVYGAFSGETKVKTILPEWVNVIDIKKFRNLWATNAVVKATEFKVYLWYDSANLAEMNDFKSSVWFT